MPINTNLFTLLMQKTNIDGILQISMVFFVQNERTTDI